MCACVFIHMCKYAHAVWPCVIFRFHCIFWIMKWNQEKDTLAVWVASVCWSWWPQVGGVSHHQGKTRYVFLQEAERSDWEAELEATPGVHVRLRKRAGGVLEELWKPTTFLPSERERHLSFVWLGISAPLLLYVQAPVGSMLMEQATCLRSGCRPFS